MKIAATERIAALAAALSAIREHRHVAVRPRSSAYRGFKLPTESKPPGAALDEAVEDASEQWPDNSDWELLGIDALEGWDGGDWDADAPAEGFYGEEPGIFGNFCTIPDSIPACEV